MEIKVGIDQAYATAIFEKPVDPPTDWLGILHIPTPPDSSRSAILYPIEGGRWSVSLIVNHGEASPNDIDEFMAFAKSLRVWATSCDMGCLAACGALSTSSAGFLAGLSLSGIQSAFSHRTAVWECLWRHRSVAFSQFS
jgi:hypothetical protein